MAVVGSSSSSHIGAYIFWKENIYERVYYQLIDFYLPGSWILIESEKQRKSLFGQAELAYCNWQYNHQVNLYVAFIVHCDEFTRYTTDNRGNNEFLQQGLRLNLRG
jgi:hypothetical protein